jgi:hypothetical protein
LLQHWENIDERDFGGTSYIPDIGAEVTNEANCGGMVTQRVFNTISRDGHQGITLPRGNSGPNLIEAVAKKFGEDVTMDQMDLLTVTDANDVPARKTLQIDVQGSAIEYVLYYTGNVNCWGAPWLYLGSREKFNSAEYRCNIPGGGIDCSQELEKIEIQGGFATTEEAQNWICPKITGWHYSYWCGGERAHYIVEGQRLDFRLGALGCDLTDVPEVPIPDPHPYP